MTRFGWCLGMALATPASAAGFAVRSPSLTEGATLPMAQVYGKSGCTGANRSPALEWASPPAGTKSFAVTLFDPDARAGKGWWHWALFNLPSSLRHLPSGAKPPPRATAGRNDFGAEGYGGACPPPGDPPHHYEFVVWALHQARLPFGTKASDEQIGAYLHRHATAKAMITLRYGR